MMSLVMNIELTVAFKNMTGERKVIGPYLLIISMICSIIGVKN